MRKVTIGTLNLTPAHKRMVQKALNSNRLSYGPLTEEFENKFASKHGNKYGIFSNSGTSALQVALHAMKIKYGWKDGDEVIIPAVTFVATYNIVTQNNLKPVLVDVNQYANINADLIESKITSRTRVIIPVHLLGRSTNMESILALAKKHNLKILEDSCEAVGVDNIGDGDVACFSFYIAHILTTGVGGMAITNDKELAEIMRSLIFHGRDHSYLKIEDDDKREKDVIEARFRFNYPGYSYRGTEMEAALGLIELKKIDKIVLSRRLNYLHLNDLLPERSMYIGSDNACMLFAIYGGADRDKLMFFLENNGIETRTVMPLTNQPYLKDVVNEDSYPRAKIFNDEWLLVGCHQDLKKDDIDYIGQKVEEFYDKAK
jgi:dTDP-4-amino-4,6-dideoxygalactose transaminase